MALDNRSIRLGRAFKNKLSRLNVVCGPSEIRWSRIVTRIEYMLEDRAQVIVVVSAGGHDPRKPSDCDIANAQLVAMVVSKQRRNMIRRKRVRVLLLYPNSVRLEIEVDVKSTTRQVKAYFASARKGALNPTIPTPLMSYLLTRQV